MKKLQLAAILIIICSTSAGQNVGIGEPNPAAKLTIKTVDGIGRSLMIKNSLDDTAYFIFANNHYMNGYSSLINSTLALGNKYFLPFDQPQLSIIAWGEISGINAGGSGSTIEFGNINNMDSTFQIRSYTGTLNSHFWGLYRRTPGILRPLLGVDGNGHVGISGGASLSRLQVYHRSSISSPTLNLYDSSASLGPILQFANAGGADDWQIRTALNSTTDKIDFMYNSVLITTLNSNGNLGIGLSNPSEKLDVNGNIKMTGELNRTATGTSNLVPVAYGNISPSGGINHSSGNITVTRTGVGDYSISIAGENYIFSSYVAVVTPVGNSTTPIIAHTNSVSGNLLIYTFNISGSSTDTNFSFVVYRQ